MAIVLWIGIVITAQSFQATPGKHAPAVVMGLLVGVGAWGVLMVKSGLAVQSDPTKIFDPAAIVKLTQRDVWIEGGFAMTVEIIEKRFRRACIWVLIAAGLSLTGLVHSYQYVPIDTGVNLVPAWKWFWGYLIIAAILFVAPWITEEGEVHV
jgi:AGZA family xanthine/uracil permease-like MFS transporter